MLTQRQKDLVDFIDGYQRSHGGVSPSFNEMAVGIGLAPKSKGRVYDMLRCLEERGAITRVRHKTRAIRVIKERYAAFRFDAEQKILRPLEKQTDIEDVIAAAE